MRFTHTHTHTHTHLEGEVGMELIVIENVADHLVEHGEERAQGSQSCEVHDMVQTLGILQAACHESIGCEIRAQQICTVSLDLGREITSTHTMNMCSMRPKVLLKVWVLQRYIQYLYGTSDIYIISSTRGAYAIQLDNQPENLCRKGFLGAFCTCTICKLSFHVGTCRQHGTKQL